MLRSTEAASLQEALRKISGFLNSSIGSNRKYLRQAGRQANAALHFLKARIGAERIVCRIGADG